MGKLIYGALQHEIRIHDRMLAHIEAVTLTRLRRNDAFALRWTVDNGREGRRTIWLHPSADLYFEYDTTEPAELEREMLDQLALAADSSAGINLKFEASDTILEVPAS